MEIFLLRMMNYRIKELIKCQNYGRFQNFICTFCRRIMYMGIKNNLKFSFLFKNKKNLKRKIKLEVLIMYDVLHSITNYQSEILLKLALNTNQSINKLSTML